MTRPSPFTGPAFNAVAVRDALGLVRLLWLDEQNDPFGPDDAEALADHLYRINALTEIGKSLRRCLELGRGNPDSIGGRAAIHGAAEAMDALLAAFSTELVKLAHKRVVSWRPRALSEGELKKNARLNRG
jgi:hypothetical protein